MQGHYPISPSATHFCSAHTASMAWLLQFLLLYLFVFLLAEIIEGSMRLLCQVYCSTLYFPVALGSCRKLEDIQRAVKPLLRLDLRSLPCLCNRHCWTWLSLKRINIFLLHPNGDNGRIHISITECSFVLSVLALQKKKIRQSFFPVTGAWNCNEFH